MTKGIYVNSSKNFQNNIILSVSEVSEQKGFFGAKSSEWQTFNSICRICYISSWQNLLKNHFVNAKLFYINRDVAQLGSALPWGGRGRRFKSCRSDFYKKQLRNVAQFGSAPCSGRGGRRFKSCHSDFFLSSRRFSQFRFFTLSLKICNSDPDS